MFAFSTGTSERRCVGFSCGRTGYVAGIWFGRLFKMISFELFAFVSFKYFSFGFSRTFLRVDSVFKLACGLLTFISTAAKERKVRNSSLILPKYCCSDKIVLSVNDLI